MTTRIHRIGRQAAWAWLLALLAAHTSWCNELAGKVWNHGAADCRGNRDPPIEVFRYDPGTYILRQNKCVHFEAPFIYVLFGQHKVFVQDTGATADPRRFPLYETVRALVEQRAAAGPALQILVTHSHSHSDHTAADSQFRNRPGITLVEPTAAAVREFFGLVNWPEGIARLDLGGRELIIMPVPGHQSESIAVYDPHTGWLLTGDSLYPGQLFVRDWPAFRASIRRLAQFAQAHPVSAIMGTHIEMSRTPGRLYAVGTTYQPQEAPLPLNVEDLILLNESLEQAGARPSKLQLDKFAVTPVGVLQRAVSNSLRWIGVR